MVVPFTAGEVQEEGRFGGEEDVNNFGHVELEVPLICLGENVNLPGCLMPES